MEGRVEIREKELVRRKKRKKSVKKDQPIKKSKKANSKKLATAYNTPKKVKSKKWLETLTFYSVLIGLIVLISSLMNGQQSNSAPKNIGGYAPMTILTGSMQSVYPKDALVIAKVTDVKELAIGDDITFLKENNSTVTHRIVAINENYMGSGQRGFETKGTDNTRKDEEVVHGENVIGKVVFSSLLMGKLVLFVRENLLMTAITLITLICLSDVFVKYLKKLLKKSVTKGGD